MRSGYRKDENFLCTSVEQSRSARRYSGSRGENIVNNEDALVFDQTWIAHAEGFRHRLPAPFGVHAGAMPFGMNSPNKAYLIKRQSHGAGQLASYYSSLIETSRLFTIGMKRDRNDSRCFVQWWALLCF